MKKVMASEVSRGLSEAGYESLMSSGQHIGVRPSSGSSGFREVCSPHRGFKSQQDGDEAAITRYFGSAGAEAEMLSRYTAVLENLNYAVAVIDDPDEERKGRKVLRVTWP